MVCTVTFRIFSIDHARNGLEEVSRVSANLDSVTAELQDDLGVRGFLELSTCNRVSLWVDSEHDVDELKRRIDAAAGVETAWDVHEDQDALRHSLRIASGLESMVVGEREIAGQIRRAFAQAQESGNTSPAINLAAEESLKTAKAIGVATELEGFGRSVVSVGLDSLGIEDWSAQRVLLIGTGAYAGAAVAQLQGRGATDIRVLSASGRAERFAADHGCTAVTHLEDGLRDATLLVTCRGHGGFVVGPEHIDTPMHILDLSLQRDVDPRVADLPGVVFLDLEAIQAIVAPGADLDAAEKLVDEHYAKALARLRSRAIDPGVVELRQQIMRLVDEEVERLPQRALTKDDTARALRRLATRLLHVPSARAKQAAADGNTALYMQALEVLYGINPGLQAETLEDERCPVTGLAVDDLETNK